MSNHCHCGDGLPASYDGYKRDCPVHGDLIERLRTRPSLNGQGHLPDDLCIEAADRIEQLEDHLRLIREAHNLDLVVASIDHECGESYLRDPDSEGYCNYAEVISTVLETIEDVFQDLAAEAEPAGADDE